MKKEEEEGTKDTARKTLVGKRVLVVDAKNASYKGMCGIVRQETRNTVVVETEKGAKTLLKNGVVLKINGVKIQGKDMVKKPEEKLKIKWQNKKM